MKRLTLALLGALTASTALADDYRAILAPSGQINRKCTVTLIYSGPSKDGDEIATYGLTAEHCFKEYGRILDVNFPQYDSRNRLVGEDTYKAKVIAVDKEKNTNKLISDLALVKFLNTDIVFGNVANLAEPDEYIVEGSDVIAVGYPKGKVRTLTKGTFGNREYVNFPDPTVDTEYYRANINVAPGNSGGGLFHKDDETGRYELVGVASSQILSAPFLTHWVPIDTIHAFVDDHIPFEPDEK